MDISRELGERPFGVKPKVAVIGGFIGLIFILLIDILTPADYRLVTLYLFPVAIIALNAQSINVIFLTIIVSALFENYLIFLEHNFEFTFSSVDLVNFSIRMLATLLIVWLARALRRSQLRVNRLAHTDSLTGLLNRRSARICLEQGIAKLSKWKIPFSVALIDVNDFKRVNDVHGHLVGDEVLTTIAQSFQGFSTTDNTFFRLGGDEFLFIANNCIEPKMTELCHHFVEKINNQMRELNYAVSLSIGEMSYSTPPSSVSEILREVDVKMYQHKMSLKKPAANF
jgi:diguanylate cyclase (GGDEF)-like protein